MARFEIKTPVAGFSGQSAGVTFTDGLAVIDTDAQAHLSALAYFRQAGYGIKALDDESAVDVLNRGGEDPATEAARLRAEIASLEDRRSLDELRQRRDDLRREVLGEDKAAEDEAEVSPAFVPGTIVEGDPAAETKPAEAAERELLAPPAEAAPVAEWRAWAVDSGRATPEQVAPPTSKADIIATHGAAYDRDREAQLSAGSDESGTAPREGDTA